MEVSIFRVYLTMFILITLHYLWKRSKKELENKKLDEMLSYLKLLINKPYKNYNIPYEIEKNFLQNNFKEAFIEKLAESILDHLNIEKNQLKLFVEYDKKFSYSNKKYIGSYIETGQDSGEIYINIKTYYTINHIVAILSHEAIHHVLRYNKFCGDNIKNEEFIDVASIYFGFGSYLMDAYKPVERVVEENWINYKRIIKKEVNMLGYLELGELNYLIDKINEEKIKGIFRSLNA